MYAGQEWVWYEETSSSNTATTENTAPLYLALFSSDKGPESLIEVSGNDFFKLYGDQADFFKHGQPLLQAHRVIKAGGRLLAKRLVAEDATLGNVIICAKLENVTTPKTDADGNPLYIDPSTGAETTTQTDTPATVSSAKITLTPFTMENCKNFSDLITEAGKKLDPTAGMYPILVVADNGRGVSTKKIRVVPDYTTSKNLNFCIYNMISVENNSTIESKAFTIDPDVIYLGTNMGIRNGIMQQLQTSYVDEGLKEFVKKLSEYTGYSEEYLLDNDILFGKNVKGIALDAISFAEDSLDISNVFGINLQSGTNGKFGDNPLAVGDARTEYNRQAVETLTGVYDDAIYDVELYKLDLVFDAAYDDDVKDAIAKLVDFRQDAFFFRDLGVDVFNYAEIVEKMNRDGLVRSKFNGDYLSTYEVIDPYSKKQIRVTMLYSMAPLMVAHFANGRNRPLAGEINDMIIKDAIKGTLNFAPRITPLINQKTLLDDLRVNFANYSGDKLVIQSLYTSKEKLGPLSYINNVLAAQEVVKAVRTYCPKIRFQFQTNNDFSIYKDAVDSLLMNYSSNFASLELIYTADPIATAQKIFTASIKLSYKNFVQSEKFDLYSLETATAATNA